MKKTEQDKAKKLREAGYSLGKISKDLNVSKSSVSRWVKDVKLSKNQLKKLTSNSHTTEVIEKRRNSRIRNEELARNKVIEAAKNSIESISDEKLRLIGTMLYWAEGGKTQRLVRFSNGDPDMIKVMMKFFRKVCSVPEEKFRGYIHIHPHLDHVAAEKYWSNISKIPLSQFFKTYRKKNISSKSKKDSLPNGVFDIYVMDSRLFLEIVGWSKGIFKNC
ncbi:hypothetical protein KC950_03310 [Candidatus Saccharibacteria bacterium]|nr:hypothetical protein [Candidatus Saccharibacteria bacterium]